MRLQERCIGVGPFLCAVLALAVLSSAGKTQAQRLERTVFIPDSLSGVVEPDCMVFDSANNTVYVGSRVSSCLIG
ncbi:MAG: hypothetical protein ABIK62_01185, partial [candidate division WOR-3 bacterium]